jgi:hypothetical protein
MSASLLLERPLRCMDCGRMHTGFLSLCGGCAEARLEREQAGCHLAQQKVRNERWRQLCPPLYRETDLAHPGLSPRLLERVGTWMPGAGQGNPGRHCLLLSGTTGRGKTRLAFTALRRVHEAGRSVYALHAGDAWDRGPHHIQGLSSAARLQYSDDPASAQAARHCLHRARTCRLLLLDDVGKERATSTTGLLSEAVSEALFALIEHRLTHRLPMILTTNTPAPTLETRLGPDRGPPLLRRLLEACEVVETT